MSKPQLLEWEILWDANPSVSVQLQSSYVATCTLFPDGTLNLKSDPEGRLQVPYYKLINMIEEARIVARHFYGEQWGEVQRKECGKCGHADDSVSYQSRYGRGLICQRCNDEETSRAAKAIDARLK